MLSQFQIKALGKNLISGLRNITEYLLCFHGNRNIWKINGDKVYVSYANMNYVSMGTINILNFNDKNIDVAMEIKYTEKIKSSQRDQHI